MIGVIANSSDECVVREFFELFKTPWEFYRADRRYDVVLCTGHSGLSPLPPGEGGRRPGEGMGLPAARVLLIYAGDEIPFDSAHDTRIQSKALGGEVSVGGMTPNRKAFGAMLPGVDHLPHTHNLEKMANSRGQPEWGAHLADELERIVALHDASNIAALVVDPIAASGGVLLPPKGYLERLREICTRHGILLVFDEVITGWGRLGTPFAAQHFGIRPERVSGGRQDDDRAE